MAIQTSTNNAPVKPDTIINILEKFFSVFGSVMKYSYWLKRKTSDVPIYAILNVKITSITAVRVESVIVAC